MKKRSSLIISVATLVFLADLAWSDDGDEKDPKPPPYPIVLVKSVTTASPFDSEAPPMAPLPNS